MASQPGSPARLPTQALILGFLVFSIKNLWKTSKPDIALLSSLLAKPRPTAIRFLGFFVFFLAASLARPASRQGHNLMLGVCCCSLGGGAQNVSLGAQPAFPPQSHALSFWLLSLEMWPKCYETVPGDQVETLWHSFGMYDKHIKMLRNGKTKLKKNVTQQNKQEETKSIHINEKNTHQ